MFAAYSTAWNGSGIFQFQECLRDPDRSPASPCSAFFWDFTFLLCPSDTSGTNPLISKQTYPNSPEKLPFSRESRDVLHTPGALRVLGSLGSWQDRAGRDPTQGFGMLAGAGALPVQGRDKV